MQLQTFTEIPGDPRFRDEWNQLVYAMESPEVFYTWEWSTAVSRSYRACVKPLLIAAFRESALAGVVALNLSGDAGAAQHPVQHGCGANPRVSALSMG